MIATRSRPTRFGSTLAALLVGLVFTAAAGGGPERAQQLEQINYATSFGLFGRDAYVYVAVDRGYFRQAGFEVNVVSGTGSVDNMKLLAAGRLDYAPIDFSALVLTRANESVPVKAVSIVHQNTLSSILTLRESGIATPKDLEGKQIADAPGSTVRALFPLYAKRAGIDASKVTFVPAVPPALPSLLASKQVDGVGQFTVGIPLFQRAAGGKPIVSLKYSKQLPGLMGIAVAASDAKISSNPAQVRRFVAALNRGLQYSIDNPGDAGRILNKYQPLADPVVAAQELKIMKPFVQTEATRRNGLGTVDVKRVNATISVIANGFKPQNRVRAADVFAQGFVRVRR